MSKILRHRPDIVTADMDGKMVMMDMETGKYYNLGAVGGRIWEVLEQPMTLEQLVEVLVGEYDVSPEQCREDVMPFVEKMAEYGLLIEE